MMFYHISKEWIIKHMILAGLVFLLFVAPLKAQDVELDQYDSILSEYLKFDSLLLEELEQDSSGIMAILDDIMSEKYLKSQLVVRAGYTSDIVNAGRDYGVQQYLPMSRAIITVI